MKKQSLLSIIIPLVLLIIGGFIFFLVTTQKQEIRSRAGVDMVDLTLSASPNPVAVGSEVSINVIITANNNYKVSAVELALTYDSAAFDPVSISAGSFLTTVLTSGSIQSGTATITLGSGTTPKTGTGTLATLKLRKKTSANGVVNVGSQTTVAGQDANGVPIPTNILGTAGSVTITSPTNTSGSPTPSSIITPTEVPSYAPTPSPLTPPAGGSSPTPFSSPTPVPTVPGGFGDLFPLEPVDAQKNPPTPLSLARSNTSTIIPEPSVPTTKPKNTIFLLLFGIAFVCVVGGATTYILQKKGIIHLPFFIKHEEQTIPPQPPIEQTQEVNPPVTDQTPTPPPTEEQQIVK
jgi:flagellar basal body-associated protein FliL